MRHVKFLFAGLLGLLLTEAVSLQAQPSYRSSNPLFTSDAVIDLYLSTDVRKLKVDRKKEKYQPAQFRLSFSDSAHVEDDIEIKTRGLLRKEMCTNPPLTFNFSKAQQAAVKSWGTAKMVLGCHNGHYEQQLVLREYLTYRFYHLITPLSFKVRLVHLHLDDSKENKKTLDQWAFFIEDIHEVAQRNHCQYMKLANPPEALDPYQLAMMNIFQFMIGNTDFTVSRNKNTKLIQSLPLDAYAPYVIPYDFDFSGMVNARYAQPHPDYQDILKTVKDRLYLGLPFDEENILSILELFKSHHQEMNALIDGQAYLDNIYKEEMKEFLQEFFDTIKELRRIREIFVYPTGQNW
ncbi:MAG: hypothetical protein ACKO6K_11465 [Chitinophagaceae bacterium]